MTEVVSPLQALIEQWKEKAAATREVHVPSRTPSAVNLPKHSERTIKTLQECADQLEAVLQRLEQQQEQRETRTIAHETQRIRAEIEGRE